MTSIKNQDLATVTGGFGWFRKPTASEIEQRRRSKGTLACINQLRKDDGSGPNNAYDAYLECERKVHAPLNPAPPQQ